MCDTSVVGRPLVHNLQSLVGGCVHVHTECMRMRRAAMDGKGNVIMPDSAYTGFVDATDGFDGGDGQVMCVCVCGWCEAWIVRGMDSRMHSCAQILNSVCLYPYLHQVGVWTPNHSTLTLSVCMRLCNRSA